MSLNLGDTLSIRHFTEQLSSHPQTLVFLASTQVEHEQGMRLERFQCLRWRIPEIPSEVYLFSQLGAST